MPLWGPLGTLEDPWCTLRALEGLWGPLWALEGHWGPLRALENHFRNQKGSKNGSQIMKIGQERPLCKGWKWLIGLSDPSWLHFWNVQWAPCSDTHWRPMKKREFVIFKTHSLDKWEKAVYNMYWVIFNFERERCSENSVGILPIFCLTAKFQFASRVKGGENNRFSLPFFSQRARKKWAMREMMWWRDSKKVFATTRISSCRYVKKNATAEDLQCCRNCSIPSHLWFFFHNSFCSDF